MGYARGRFGVEYHPQGGAETHHLRGLVCIVLALVAVAFVWYKIAQHRSASPDGAVKPRPRDAALAKSAPEPAQPPVQSAVLPTPRTCAAATAFAAATNGSARPRSVTLPRPKPTPTVAPAVRPLVAQLEETRERRSHQDQILIDRYTVAERDENAALAIDAIRKLYNRPTMADLKDPLLRRLGDLNHALLFSGKSTPWTSVVAVRRGDGRERIAREHRTTPAAVARLNPAVKWEKLRPGDTIRVLEFPNACLVIHKALGYADLSFKNDQFFRRYSLTTAKSAKCGVYAIAPEDGSTLHARFRELGVKLAAPDRAELEMFLAPGSRLTVTEQ